ncbi:MAG: recombinase family protein [Gomphosphaeria aponina SAG 52.96 = DSM 107014]|uniref:Recombinase family protein n=1 Tax=Gomphosphaeria aponina SAG 52.96 = DSM 107014 TaxID=1521640 RepID=A0A941GMY2_9CHRO|nr:recombinase family protein [Gomphosphaeria aponina SAG 52.96 = DSM 107014]
MTTIAYLFSNPLLDPPGDPLMWGLEVERVYQDWGKRNELQQLILDCEKQPPKYLLMRRLEELGDTLEEISDRLLQIESLGIKVIVTEQTYNFATFAQLLQEIQTNLGSRSLRLGQARNRINALPPPGKAPYGYRRGKDRYLLDRSTACVIKDFFDQFLLYGSIRGAVRYLEKRYGKKISVSTGSRWLTHPVYRGDLGYHNQDVIPNTHQPILSREEAAQIDRLLRRNGRLATRSASAPRSLAGLVLCQQCQSPMTITRVTTREKKREYLYLRPINCQKSPKCKAIAYQAILAKTITCICEDLPRQVAGINSNNLEGIKGDLTVEINKKQDIIAQLPSLQEQGILDAETAQLRRYKLATEISQLRSQLAGLPPGNLKAIAQTVSLPQFWLDLSETERRFYFREFIRQIELIRSYNNIWELKLVFIF